ncbi:MAG: ATP-binding protein, partial [Cyanobacteria bacterium J06649_4]
WQQDYENGYKFGQMAVQLCDQFDNADVRSMTNFVFGSDVQSWSRPIREADSYYETAYRFGMEAGNWLTVSFMMMLSGSDRLTYGKNLNDLYQIVQTQADFLKRIQSLVNLDVFVAGVVQPIRQLLGLTQDIRSLDDDSFSEADYLSTYQSADYALAWLYAIKIRHAVLFKDEALYAQLVDRLSVIEVTIATHAKVPSSTLYTALMHLWLREHAEGEAEKALHAEKFEALATKLQNWAKTCPENIEHKCLILEGEKARLNRQWAIASEKYDRAIALANQNRYHYEAAFAGELAAQLFIDWEKPRLAKEYLTESYISYERWGAIAKLKHLEQAYPSFFKEGNGYTALGPSVTVRETYNCFSSDHSIIPSRSLSRRSHSLQNNLQSLDLTSLLKASQALSSEVQLEPLMTALLRITLENAGANRCALLLPQDEELQIKAIAHNNSCFEIEHLTASLTADQELSLSVVQSVQQTLKTLIIDDARVAASLKEDTYIIQHQPKSILCFPIQRSGKLSGILYLENRHTAHAFTPKHLEVLKIISTQAAISLENSLLYEQQDALVQSKTRDLRQALADLKISQMRLVQKEKMSSLGQLVSGIAHEINNPINFIYGNIKNTRRYIQDIITLLDSYQTHYPHPNEEVAELIEETEIEFIVEDLDKTLGSMKLGTERIRDIVLSLRNFSRLDEAKFKAVDIHEGIDSALMLLENRIKAIGKQKRISIDKHYGTLPKIACFASEMNQVFFNILSNAIDAISDESPAPEPIKDKQISHQQISRQTQATPGLYTESEITKSETTESEITKSEITESEILPCICIQTEHVENSIVLLFSDNGKGIDEQILDKVFDPFFTTKAVGQGTGMGLAIAHQIITEKHKGSLSVTSQVGKGSTFSIMLPLETK